MQIIYSDRFLDHHTGWFHPEQPERVTAIVKRLKTHPINSQLEWKEPTPIEQRSDLLAWISMVHDSEYIRTVELLSNQGGGRLDGDTPVSEASYEVALLAVSAWLDAVDTVLNRGLPVFTVARPPGHHALKNRGMGFCIFNNAVIAAKYALTRYKLNKVAILDWDVHHGNGTQELVWNDRQIAYVSAHQAPFYPGTGWQNETGNSGNILNIPLPSGTGSNEYMQVFDRFVIPFLQQFMADLLIVSAGFDANSGDPLASMELQPEDFGAFAQKCRQNFSRVIFGLEGGYDLGSLANSVLAVVSAYAN